MPTVIKFVDVVHLFPPSLAFCKFECPSRKEYTGLPIDENPKMGVVRARVVDVALWVEGSAGNSGVKVIAVEVSVVVTVS